MTTLSTARGRSALAVSSVFTCLATLLAFSWMFFGVFVGEVYHGMGAHYTSLTPAIFKTQMIVSRHQADPTVPGFCFDKKALWFSNSAIHILTDVLILIYPMPVLGSLQLPKRQKVALMAVFALGGFVMITSILRLQSLLVISNSSDLTYDNTGAASWSAVECNVAIICAYLPSVRAFISRFRPHIFSTRSNGYQSGDIRPFTIGRGGGPDTNHQIRATVSGDGGTEQSYDSSSDSRRSHTKGDWEKEGFVGIKVTTFVTQESTVCLSEVDVTGDDTASARDPRDKEIV